MAKLDCPRCHSQDYWKDGVRKTRNGSIQRYFCRVCGYRFSESLALSTHFIDSGGCQVCAPLMGAKNLAKVEPLNDGPAGATNDVKSLLFQFGWWMKKQGYAEQTVETKVKLLRILVNRGANLSDPESIKEAIARQNWVEKRKMNAVDAYTTYLRMLNQSWDPPRYKGIRNLPFIPTETEIDQLIAGCSRILIPLLQLLKETGVRIGEATMIKWIDLDYENRTVRITPEKGSNPRILPISNTLKAALSELQAFAKSERLFPNTPRDLRRAYEIQRKRIASNLHNPRISKITFHTFRHFKATMEYYRTNNILHVMEILGHRSILNTMIYTKFMGLRNDDYSSQVAKTVEEACKLVDSGFDYVCEIDGSKIFRKRK
ncbi:tyrosine-type recombinase/integrase [Candidatus Bathyarchaeota archaeon]|nr:tyrosine-type recombinase/integrase [Candidatus Bathyarchaeota archaeon]